jgi:hypothetical protein
MYQDCYVNPERQEVECHCRLVRWRSRGGAGAPFVFWQEVPDHRWLGVAGCNNMTRSLTSPSINSSIDPVSRTS